MQLLIKRSKMFIDGGKQLLVAVNAMPQSVPHWVKETQTYIHGVKDGSIINLTDVAAKQEAELAAEEQREPDPVNEESTEEETGEPAAQEAAENPAIEGLVQGTGRRNRRS